MFRRGFLKAALGASAAVALGEMGFGKQDAEAQSSVYCTDTYGKFCAGDLSCSGTCRAICRLNGYRDCDYCADVRSGICEPPPTPAPDPCARFNAFCAPGYGGICGLACEYGCTSGGGGSCAICQDRVC